MSRMFLSIAATIATVVITALPVAAGPLLPTDLASAPSLVTHVHGCHRSAAVGPEEGECHVHVRSRSSNCEYRRVPAYQCGGYRGRGYDDEPRYERGRTRRYEPRCYQDCKYVGPIKVCETRCR